MKSYFSSLNLKCTCSQLSFEVHIVYVAKNLKFFIFLPRKLTFDIRRLLATKLCNLGGCFWHLLKGKDQKFYFRCNLGLKKAKLAALSSFRF